MPNESENCDGWAWKHPMGTLHCGGLTGRVDVSRPQLGLHQLRLGSESLDGNLFGITWASTPEGRPSPVAEAYVRGNDLVAKYAPRADWPYATEVYWRADAVGPSNDALASLVLWVSVETDLLETHPQIDVVSRLPAEESLCLTVDDDRQMRVEQMGGVERRIESSPTAGTIAIVRRLPRGEVTCAEIMRASDFRQADVQRGKQPTCRSRWQLFADFLEKGVIRRACLQLVVLPRADDVAEVSACCQAFRSRPLPLTT